jgi:hypothetical protein
MDSDPRTGEGRAAPVAPDDTLTRLALKGVNHSDDQYHLKQLRAEVSRLQQENALLRRSLEMLGRL